jgi:Domain of unknown function (DUF4136)
LLIAALAACASKPDVRHDQDPTADLTAYKTFGFYDPLATDRARYSTILSSRLKQATRERLERQHYVYSETSPDLRVNLFVNVVERQELHATPVGRGFYGYRGWATSLDTVEYRQGTLAIDLVDVRRNALVWQGVAEGRLDPKLANDPGPGVDAVVQQIFAGFPNPQVK